MRHDHEAAARMAGGTAPDSSVGGGAVVWLDVTLVSSVCGTDNTLGEHTDTLLARPLAARKAHGALTGPTDVAPGQPSSVRFCG
ncbi:hypothetical protein GCM10010413_45150 [Promicromonospora sukumoe]